MAIRLLVVAFFVFYVGSESGYGGWISSYVLRRGVVDDKTQAAFVASVYWGGLTAGRLLAIPIAITLTTSTHLQAQLAQAVVGVVLCLTILDNSYLTACGLGSVPSLCRPSSPWPLPWCRTTVPRRTPLRPPRSFCVVCGRRLHASGGGPTHGGISPLALPWTMAFFTAMLIVIYTVIVVKSRYIHARGPNLY